MIDLGPNYRDVVQRSGPWEKLVCGSLGGSRIHDATARGAKGGYLQGRFTLMYRIIAERLTGVLSGGGVSMSMQHGIDTEPLARAAYAFDQDVEVTEVGVFLHPEIKGAHASPDGLVGLDGMVEIKCPNSATHIESLLTGSIEKEYLAQMQWEMACANRQWCDFVSFDARLPDHLRLFIKRVPRDPLYIKTLEMGCLEFQAEVNVNLDKLKNL